MGTIGTPAAIAAWNAPVLNGISPRPRLRVPSGNIQIEMSRFLNCSATCAMVPCALARLSRSISRLPVSQYSGPKNGTHSRLFLPTVTVRGCTALAAVTIS
ncbi:hypothetical protein D3C78_1686320 [compost metagenome]